jgi:hemin uptake protein HemP
MTPADRPPAAAPAGTRRVLSSGELFAEAREVVIVHGQDEYRLRITRAGKLILTK